MKGRGADKFEKYLMDLFLHKRSSSLPAGLSKHLDVCDSCRKLFVSLALADRQMAEECGANVQVSAFESEVLWKSLSNRLDIHADERDGIWPSRLQITVSVVTMFLVIFSLFFFDKWNSLDSSATQGVVARGVSSSPMVQLYCMDSSGSEPRLLEADKAACGIRDTLAFAYMNPHGKFSGVALFALDSQNRPVWYLPDPIHSSAVSIHATSRFEAIPKIVRLAVNHKPGHYSLYYMFTPHPLDFDELKRVVQDISKGKLSPTGAFIRKVELAVEEQR